MKHDQGVILDRLAFSQMILAALSHDFVTPFRTANYCCKELQDFAKTSSIYNGADILQIERTRTAISQALFPKLTGLHDEAKRFHRNDPKDMVEFLVGRVDQEIAERLDDLRAVMALADARNPHKVLDAVLDRLATTIQKIAAMMEGIKATVNEPETAHKTNWVDVSQAIARVDEILGPLHKSLLIHVQGNVELEADSWRVWSVFSNLIGNAIKYAKPGSGPYIEIRVGVATAPEVLWRSFRSKLEKDRVSDRHYGLFLDRLLEIRDWCEIQVTDFGIGIPAKRLWGVFKLFKQLNKISDYEVHDVDEAHVEMLSAYLDLESKKSKGHMGIGMGLALTQYYVRSQGGEVAVSSRTGGPTTFGIWFPLTSASNLNATRLRDDVWWRDRDFVGSSRVLPGGNT